MVLTLNFDKVEHEGPLSKVYISSDTAIIYALGGKDLGDNPPIIVPKPPIADLTEANAIIKYTGAKLHVNKGPANCWGITFKK